MDPDRLAFHQHRLERLDAEAVQRGGAVQEHRMVLDDLFQDLVHLRRLLLDDLLGPLDRLGDPLLHQLVDDEGLEQLDRHRLGEPALMQPRSEEHTSELQSLAYLVCRLLLEKKKKTTYISPLAST